ncbi:MAG: phosphoglycolate phosphatase [Sulfurovaceae bacterium]|nr:phosphoglycolate phosphatase [Sulfurovaceae bacterium]
MLFKNKKVIIFDLDGTLIDSVPDLAVAINSMLKTIERDTFDENTIRKWVGNGAGILVDRALSGSSEIDESIDKAFRQKALDIFSEFYQNNLAVYTVAYPNVLNTLKNLKDRGYILTIVTNKSYKFVEPILKGLGIYELFEFYLGADSLKEKKPHPEPLLYVCDKLNVSIDDCIMVGDSQNDILSANSCGMDSIGVTYGYNYGEEISIYNPTVVIDDFIDIISLLN